MFLESHGSPSMEELPLSRRLAEKHTNCLRRPPSEKPGDEFLVEAQMEGASAKELNRTLLSALRRVEKRTTRRAE